MTLRRRCDERRRLRLMIEDWSIDGGERRVVVKSSQAVDMGWDDAWPKRGQY